jgi:hypothetical protein
VIKPVIQLSDLISATNKILCTLADPDTDPDTDPDSGSARVAGHASRD